MKFLESIKEIWKVNKKGFFISGLAVSLGCVLLFAKHKSPLIATIPLGWVGLLFFMFTFGLFFGGND